MLNAEIRHDGAIGRELCRTDAIELEVRGIAAGVVDVLGLCSKVAVKINLQMNVGWNVDRGPLSAAAADVAGDVNRDIGFLNSSARHIRVDR